MAYFSILLAYNKIPCIHVKLLDIPVKCFTVEALNAKYCGQQKGEILRFWESIPLALNIIPYFFPGVLVLLPPAATYKLQCLENSQFSIFVVNLFVQ